MSEKPEGFFFSSRSDDLSDKKNDRHIRRTPEHDQHDVQHHPEGQPQNDADDEAFDRAVFENGIISHGCFLTYPASCWFQKFLAGFGFLFPSHPDTGLCRCTGYHVSQPSPFPLPNTSGKYSRIRWRSRSFSPRSFRPASPMMNAAASYRSANGLIIGRPEGPGR